MMITVVEIIAAFGGGAALTRALGYQHRSRISNWHRIGIPEPVWPVLVDLARERGLAGITYEALREANERLVADQAERAV